MKLFLIAGLGILSRTLIAAEFDSAAQATNQLGLDLFRKLPAQENLCLSPYSIADALAMTLSGAEGETRAEMLRVLHLDPKAEADASFRALQQALDESAAKSSQLTSSGKKRGSSEPTTLAVANRIFPQSGYELRPAFIAKVQEFYGAPPEPLDFKEKAGAATERINQWVAEKTRDRIQNLIPSTLSPATRLVLANALYFKAAWSNEFSEGATQPEPFQVNGAPTEVPTMVAVETFGYEERQGYAAIALPYVGDELQFIVLLPAKDSNIAALEKQLDAKTLASCASLPRVDLDLHFPKFKFEPPTIPLAEKLQALGMKLAFDLPPGSANFERMAPRRPNDYLLISEVFHKTFITVDEKGTEAAAATAVAMAAGSALRPEPLEVKVDRPFVYAIQHVPSGVCLFIGRVTDPRGSTR